MEKLQDWERSGKQNEPRPTPRMHEDDAINFLKLATVLKVVLARSVRERELTQVEALFMEYLQCYVRVRKFSSLTIFTSHNLT